MTALRDRLAVALLVGASAVGFAGCGGAEAPTKPLAARTGLPFAEPPEVRSSNGVLRTTLVAERRAVDISGSRVEATVYNGRFAAPTLRARPGDRIELTLVNRLPEPTNLHFHGFHVSPSGNSDNVFLNVPAGRTQNYVVHIPPDHEPGTFWYHSHRHPIAEEQVFGGLSGILIVDGLDRRMGLSDVRQRVFALKDVQVESSAPRIVRSNINSDAPTTRLVNGLAVPALEVRPGETQLWRLANIGADIWYRLRLDGQPFTVVAEDGNVPERTRSEAELVLPPGKRYDVLVRGPAAGTKTRLRTLFYNQQGDQYPARVLATVRASGSAQSPLSTPGGLGPQARATLGRLDSAPVARRRQVVFTEDDSSNRFFIDGRQFGHDSTVERVKLGTVEEWTILNRTSEQHPFHIHVDDFQVRSVDGRPYRATGTQDTVALPANGRVVIRLAFTDYTGRFVFHCHILNHEDNGMMATVQVER